MSDETSSNNRSSLRRHAGGLVALFALLAVGAAWLWIGYHPQNAIGAPEGVVVLGGGVFIIALLAEIRILGLVTDLLGAAVDFITSIFD